MTVAQYLKRKPWLKPWEMELRRTYALTGLLFLHLNCPSCGVCPVGFMVKDKVWLAAGLPLGANKAGYWCRSCFETKLGRPLVVADLLDVPLSDWLFLELHNQHSNTGTAA